MGGLDDLELLDAIEELAVAMGDGADPVDRLIAIVTRDESVAPFVTVVPAAPTPDAVPGAPRSRFRVVDTGPGEVRTWGFGEVFASVDELAVTLTWIRPAPAAPLKLQTYDAVNALRQEVLFRFAYLYGLRDVSGAPLVPKDPKDPKDVKKITK